MFKKICKICLSFAMIFSSVFIGLKTANAEETSGGTLVLDTFRLTQDESKMYVEFETEKEVSNFLVHFQCENDPNRNNSISFNSEQFKVVENEEKYIISAEEFVESSFYSYEAKELRYRVDYVEITYTEEGLIQYDVNGTNILIANPNNFPLKYLSNIDFEVLFNNDENELFLYRGSELSSSVSLFSKKYNYRLWCEIVDSPAMDSNAQVNQQVFVTLRGYEYYDGVGYEFIKENVPATIVDTEKNVTNINASLDLNELTLSIESKKDYGEHVSGRAEFKCGEQTIDVFFNNENYDETTKQFIIKNTIPLYYYEDTDKEFKLETMQIGEYGSYEVYHNAFDSILNEADFVLSNKNNPFSNLTEKDFLFEWRVEGKKYISLYNNTERFENDFSIYSEKYGIYLYDFQIVDNPALKGNAPVDKLIEIILTAKAEYNGKEKEFTFTNVPAKVVETKKILNH